MHARYRVSNACNALDSADRLRELGCADSFMAPRGVELGRGNPMASVARQHRATFRLSERTF